MQDKASLVPWTPHHRKEVEQSAKGEMEVVLVCLHDQSSLEDAPHQVDDDDDGEALLEEAQFPSCYLTLQSRSNIDIRGSSLEFEC